ncbi:MAG: BspA family leucine-rich repeat surface protein, partial [Cytophagales bacterium]
MGQTTSQAGPWGAGSTWVGGTVPISGATVTIAHNVTITSTISDIGTLTINAGVTLNPQGNNITVTGTTTVNGTFIDNVAGGTNTFGVINVISGGSFTASGGVSSFSFGGNITNAGTFNINISNYSFVTNLSITNSSASNMTFNAGTAGQATATINSSINVTVLSSIGDVELLDGDGINIIGTLANSNDGGPGAPTTTSNLIGTGTFINNPNGYLNYVGNAAPTVTNFNVSAGGSTFWYNGSGNHNIRAATYHKLRLANNRTLSLTAPLTVNENLELLSNVILDVVNATYTVDIKGILNVGGSSNILHRNGTFTFTGANANTGFVTTESVTLYDVVINKTANTDGVAFNNFITVLNTLTLTRGLMYINNNSLTLSNITASNQISPITPTSQSYIVVVNSTFVRNNLLSNNSYIFPVGTSATYNPLSITPSANTNITSRLLSTGTPSLPSTTANLDVQWGISSSVAITANSVQMNWQAANVTGIITGASSRFYNGTSWVSQGGSAIGTQVTSPLGATLPMNTERFFTLFILSPKTASVSGNWNNPAIWSPVGVPLTSDDVFITGSGTVVTVDIASVIVNNLAINNGATLNVGTFSPIIATLSSNGNAVNTFRMSSVAGASNITNASHFRNAFVTNNTVVWFDGGNYTIPLNLGNTGTGYPDVWINGGTKTLPTTGNFITKNLVINVGALQGAGSANTLNIGGELEVKTGTTFSNLGYVNINLSSNLIVNGTFILSTGTAFSFSAGTAAVTISGVTNPINFGNAAVTVANNKTVTNNATNSVTMGGTLTLGSTASVFINDGGGIFTLVGQLSGGNFGCTFRNATNRTFNYGAGIPTLSGGTFDVDDIGNTVNYNGVAAQTIAPVTHHHITFSNAGNKTLFNNIIAGNWTNDATGTVTNSGTITFAGNTTQIIGGTSPSIFNNLTININNTNVGGVDIGTTTVTGTNTLTIAANALLRVGGIFPSGFGTYTLNAASTVEYYANSAQTVFATATPAFNYGNLILSGSGNKTLSNDFTVNRNLTVNTSAVMLFGGTLRTVTVNGNVSGSGTIDLSNIGHILELRGENNAISTLNAGVNGSTVRYNRQTGIQQVIGTTYQNLEFVTQTSIADKIMTGVITLNTGGTVFTLGNNNKINQNGFDFNVSQAVFNGSQTSFNANVNSWFYNNTLSPQGYFNVTNNNGVAIIPNATIPIGSLVSPMRITAFNYSVTGTPDLKFTVQEQGINSFPTIAGNPYVKSVWNIQTTGTATISSLTFNWTAISETSLLSSGSLYRHNGTNWAAPLASYSSGFNILYSASPAFGTYGVFVPLAGTTYYSRDDATNISTTGADWASGTWSSTGHDGLSCGCVPNAGDNVIIKAGHRVNITTTTLVNITNLEVNGVLDFGNNTTALNPISNLQGTGRLRFTSTSSPITLPTITTNNFTDGTVEFYANTNGYEIPISFGSAYPNLEINAVGQTITLPVSGGSGCTVNKNFKITAGNFNPLMRNITVEGTTIIDGSFTDTDNANFHTFKNNITVGVSGTFSSQSQVNISPLVNMSVVNNNSASPMLFGGSSLSLQINSNNAITFDGNMNFAGNFAVNSANFPTINFAGSTTKTYNIIGNVIIDNTTVNNAGTLNISGNSISNATFNNLPDAYLKLSGNFAPNFFNASAVGNTVEYNGANQTIMFTFGNSYYNLLISGTGITTSTSTPFPRDTDVAGTLTIANGSTFRPASATFVRLSGDLINNGTFDANLVTVELIGGGNQNIGGTSTTTFYTLDIRKTAAGIVSISGQTADDGVIVENVLFLGNGGAFNFALVELTDKNLVLGNNTQIGIFSNIGDGETAGTYTPDNMIRLTDTGKLVRWFSGPVNIPFIFPVGTGTTYSPAIITLNTNIPAAGTLSLSLKNAPSGFNIGQPTKVLQRKWTIENSGLTLGTPDLKFNYPQVDVQGDEAQYVSAYRQTNPAPSSWYKGSNGTINDVTNDILFNPISNFNGSAASFEFTAGMPEAFCTNNINTIGPLTAGTVGVSYTNTNFAITTSQGAALSSVSFSGALPAGLTASIANSGVDNFVTISGTPTVVGTYNFGLTITDVNGCVITTTSAAFQIVVSAAPTTYISTGLTDDWNLPTAWNLDQVPNSSTDNVFIQKGHIINIAPGSTINVANLTLEDGDLSNDGGRLNVAPSGSNNFFTIGTLSVGNKAVLQFSGSWDGPPSINTLTAPSGGSTIRVGGADLIPSITNIGTYDNTNKVVFYGSGYTIPQNINSSTNFQNVEIEGVGIGSFEFGGMTIDNDFTVLSAPASFNGVGDALTINKDFVINSGGSFDPQAINLTVSGISTIDGTFNDTNAAGTNTFKNNIIVGATGIFSTSSHVVIEQGTNDMNITNNNSSPIEFNGTPSLTRLSSSNILDFEGNMNFANLFKVNTASGGADINFNGGSIIVYNFNATITSMDIDDITINNNATINIDGDVITSDGATFSNLSNSSLIIRKGFNPTLVALSPNNTVEYASGVPQNIVTTAYQNLVISDNTATKTLSGNITVAGDFTNNVGANFLANSNKVTFNGTTAQSISGATTFFDLEINNANAFNVFLQANTEVSNSLTLTNGKLITSANTLQLSGTSYATQLLGTPFSSSKYIVTSAGGQFNRLNVDATIGNVEFPIGATTSDYTPLTFTNTGNFGSVGVSVRDEAGTITQSPKVNRIWNIATSGATNPNIKFDWQNANELPAANALTTLAKVHQNSSAWTDTGITTTYTAGTQTASATGIPAGNSGNRDFAMFTTTSAPTITNFTPTSGAVGTSITITGTNFNPSASNDVYFGAVKVTANADATGTSITVTVPLGSTSVTPIVARNNATSLQGSSMDYGKLFTVINTPILTVNSASYNKTDINLTDTPVALASADFDNDSRLDMIVTKQSGSGITILSGDGSGGFTPSSPITITNPIRSVVTSDFNNDGWADFALAGGNDILIYLNNGSGVFTTPITTLVGFTFDVGLECLAVGDFNSDGNFDLVIADYFVNRILVYAGNGSGGFTQLGTTIITPTPPRGLSVGDLSGDGKPDFVVSYSNGGTQIGVYINDGTGTSFTPQAYTVGTPSANHIGTRIADFDKDGIPDVAVVVRGDGGSIQVFKGNGTTLNATSTTIDISDNHNFIEIGDLNGDDKIDLVAAKDDGNVVSVALNTNSVSGIMSFGTPFTINTNNNSNAIVVGNFNGDGKADIAVANGSSNTVSILRYLPNYYTIGNATWNANGNWSNTDGGTDCNCNPASATGANITIKAGHIVTVPASTTITSNTIKLEGTNGNEAILDANNTGITFPSTTFASVGNQYGIMRVVSNNIPTLTTDFINGIGNVVEFQGDGYAIPAVDYPQLNINSGATISLPNSGTINAKGLSVINGTFDLAPAGSSVINLNINGNTGLGGSSQIITTISNSSNYLFEGDFEVGTGTTANFSNNTITFKGNFINNGTFLSAIGSSIIFNGANQQDISGNTTTFANLNIDNTSNISLATTINVSNNLTLTNGKIQLASNNLTYEGTNLTRINGWIETNGSGVFERIGSGSNFTYPVGNDSEYQPITIASPNNPSSVRFGAVSALPIPNSGVGAWFVDNGSIPSDIILVNPQGGNLTSGTSKVGLYATNWVSQSTTNPIADSYQSNVIFSGTTQEISVYTCPTITLGILPNAIVGTPYSQTITVSGGTAPYTYTQGGALPTGLSLNNTTGVISGTPITSGSFNFDITATDANGCTGTRNYSSVLIVPNQPLGNRGLYFDGQNDYVNIGNVLGTTFQTEFTAEAWIKPTRTGTNRQNVIFSKWSVGNNASDILFSHLENSGNSLLFFSDADGTNITTPLNSITFNKWSHVALVYKQTPRSYAIYIDGVLQASGTDNNLLITNTNTFPLRIGAIFNGGLPQDVFTGQIDEVRIFSSVRDASQIQLDMSTQTPNGASAYWNFDDDAAAGVQTQAVDIAGANNGTLQNGALWAMRVTDNTDTGSAGLGSLRQAITEANTDTDKDYIDFSIDNITPTLRTITLGGALPNISNPVFVDGFSALGSDTQLRIDINGNSNNIFDVNANNSTLQGLIMRNGATAVNINSVSSANKISQNNIFSNTTAINLNGTGNGSKSAPFITSATTSFITGTGVTGDIIEIFENNPLETQGRTYKGQTTVIAGTWGFAGTFTLANAITSTATDVTNGTSAFSTPQSAVVSNPFRTTWITTDTQILIPIRAASGAYNYGVSWRNLTNPGVQEGNSIIGQTADYTITGLQNNSVYQIDIIGTFPHFYMDNNATNRTKLRTIEQWGDIAWASMQNSFWGCSNLTYTATDIPILSPANNMQGMFRDCSAFNGNISSWNVSNVTSMQGMFNGASVFNRDISSWNVSNVTSFDGMFQFASAFNQDLSNWNFSTISNISALSMFYGAGAFNNGGVILNWGTKTTRFTNMANMFAFAGSFNQDISSWNVNNVTTMANMFENAIAFNQSLATWQLRTLGVNMTDMLNNCGMNTANYDATLIGWAGQAGAPTGVTLGATSRIYCTAINARNTLTNSKGWTILNDAISPACLPTQPLGNRGIYLNGGTEHIVANTPSTATDNFTVEAWVKLSRVGGQIIRNGLGYSMFIDGNGRFMVELIGIGYIQTDYIITLNRWTHLAIVRNGGIWAYYADGVVLNRIAGPANTTPPNPPSVNLFIGERSDITYGYYKGQVDEVRIFNVARTQAQIQLDMATQTPNGAAAYWNFDDDATTGVQTQAVDIVGGNNGTLQNGALWALRVTDDTDNGSAGLGSLRQAITEANTDTDTDYIDFSIPTTGTKTITLAASSLPEFSASRPVFLDGWSQEGSTNTTPMIEINGNNVTDGIGLDLLANNSIIRGMVINRFNTGTATNNVGMRILGNNNHI